MNLEEMDEVHTADHELGLRRGSSAQRRQPFLRSTVAQILCTVLVVCCTLVPVLQNTRQQRDNHNREDHPLSLLSSRDESASRQGGREALGGELDELKEAHLRLLALANKALLKLRSESNSEGMLNETGSLLQRIERTGSDSLQKEERLIHEIHQHAQVS